MPVFGMGKIFLEQSSWEFCNVMFTTCMSGRFVEYSRDEGDRLHF